MPAITRTAFELLKPLLANEAFGQLVRFAIAGAGVTLFCVGIYLACAIPLGINAMVANLLSHAAGVAAGYAIHSRWSFRAEPGRDGPMLFRFAIASVMALALNSAWVWVAVDLLHGPAWLPAPAMVFVTPLASFALNRYWVFARA